MTFKPVGVDENSNFPTRVVNKLKSMFPALDVNGKVADSALPNRLQDTALSATYQDKTTAIRVADLFISLGKYGSPGADNTSIIAQAFVDAGMAVTTSGPRGHDGTYGPAARAVYIPAGVWTTTATVTIPRGVSVAFANGAVLRASAAITGPLLDTDSLAWEGQSITGGTLDCNLLAQDGLRIRVGRYSAIRDLHIDDAMRYGVILGDTSLSASSFEMKLHNVTVRRRQGQTVVVGSQAFNIAKCSDSMFDSCVGISFETGFYNTGGDNRFLSCHVWGFTNAYPSYAFDDVSGALSHYSLCVADSPSVAGFRFRNGYASASQCSVFLASTQVDNTVIAYSIGAGSANMSFANCRAQGGAANVRLAYDYKGDDDVWLTTSNVVSRVTEWTVNMLPSRNTFAPYSVGGQLAEARYYVPGAVTVTDLPVSIFWTVPVQVDTVLIRANGGSGSQFQVWQGGTQLTPTFNAGDVTTLNNPSGSGVPVKLTANTGLYVKCVTAGTGQNLSIVFKARVNG